MNNKTIALPIKAQHHPELSYIYIDRVIEIIKEGRPYGMDDKEYKAELISHLDKARGISIDIDLQIDNAKYSIRLGMFGFNATYIGILTKLRNRIYREVIN